MAASSSPAGAVGGWRDIALLEDGGEPLLRRVVRRLAAVTDELVVGPAERRTAAIDDLPASLVPDR